MTFFEHLTELRKRIIHSLYAIGIGAFIGVYLSKYVVAWIDKPMLKALSDAGQAPKLIYTHPAGGLNLVITLGVYLGIVLDSPVVLYQIWLFVAPALYKHERGAITGFMFSTVFLFLAGIAFGYFITLPYVLHFLVSPGSLFMIHDLQPMISINDWYSAHLEPRHNPHTSFHRSACIAGECLVGHAITDLCAPCVKSSRDKPDSDVAVRNDPKQQIGAIYNRKRAAIELFH